MIVSFLSIILKYVPGRISLAGFDFDWLEWVCGDEEENQLQKSIHILFVICRKRYQDWADFSRPQSIVIFLHFPTSLNQLQPSYPNKRMLFWMTGEFLGSSWVKKDCCSLQVFNADILLWHFWLWIVRLIYNLWNYDIGFSYFWIRNSYIRVLYLVSTQFSAITNSSDFFINIRVLCSQWVLAI